MAFMSRATHVLQWPVQSVANREGELIAKTGLSSDWSLQLDCMKLESLVIADQHAAVNTFPGLVHTARHITKVAVLEVAALTRKGGRVTTVWSVIGVKS
jgi:hypothetical protein